MKKTLKKLGLVFVWLGPAIYFAVIMIAILLGRKNLGETLGYTGLTGLLIFFLGLVLLVVHVLLGRFSKAKI